MIEIAKFWYICLGYIGLNLLRKTALITKGIPDFSNIYPKHIACKSCNITKLLYQPFFKAVINPFNVLRRIKENIFVIRFIPLNNKLYKLILVDRKICFKIIKLLKSKDKVITKAKAAIKEINNTFK